MDIVTDAARDMGPREPLTSGGYVSKAEPGHRLNPTLDLRPNCMKEPRGERVAAAYQLSDHRIQEAGYQLDRNSCTNRQLRTLLDAKKPVMELGVLRGPLLFECGQLFQGFRERLLNRGDFGFFLLRCGDGCFE